MEKVKPPAPAPTPPAPLAAGFFPRSQAGQHLLCPVSPHVPRTPQHLASALQSA